MKYPTTRFVFDRKKIATTTKSAVIQVEILYERRKKYITTGVKVYKDQWSQKSGVVKHQDMIGLNDRIQAIKSQVDNYILGLAKNGSAFSWDEFERFLRFADMENITFVDYIFKRINERTDITEGTKKAHRRIVGSLNEYGRLIGFEQLTRGNILNYYEWLLGRDITMIGRDGLETKRKMSTQTVASYMKILRTYIHDAIVHGKLERDPSMGIRVKRGEYEQTRWLTAEEMEKIENARLSSGALVRVRDIFVFSCYSGLAYSDLMDFSTEKLNEEDGEMYLSGHRKKTGEEYIVLILPKAKEILEKYGYHLPTLSNQQYNEQLKKVAREAGVDKPISSHWGRITAGMTFLNNGVRLEVVAKILGHSSIKTTEKTYASILRKTVVREMKKMTKGDTE